MVIILNVEMTPRTRKNPRHEPEIEYPLNSNNEEMPSSGELLNTIKEMIKMMAQLKEKMSVHKNSV